MIGEDGTYPNVFGEAHVSIDPNSDIYTLVPEQPATCYEDGNIAYFACSNGCYYTFADGVYSEIDLADTVIPGGHVYGEDDWTPATFADCGNDGVLPHFTCTRCGDPIDLEGNVMDTTPDPATGDHDWSVVWTWTQDYTASAAFTCSVCGQEKTLEAEVTYSAGVYTASVELDGQPYTDQKAKLVLLTFDMGGKCENYVVRAQVGTALMLHYMNATRAAQAEGFRISGFTPGLPESYTTYEEFSAAINSVYMGTVPETDFTYYANWNLEVTPAITVGGLKCGASLPSALPEITPAEPDKYYIPENLIWEEGTQGAAVGGEAYGLYITVSNQYGYILNGEVPAVEGAALEEYRLTGLLDLLFVYVTAEHYTDDTSAVEERILKPATATEDGEKQICVYCAGGCGEIVETRTEPIPATGEPEEPADTDDVCLWCGETHDKRTFTGFWTSFLHDLLFIIRQLVCGWF